MDNRLALTPPQDQEARQTIDSPATVAQTSCCVVGGGPAGAMLALLLARRGVPVTLLEAHKDFDRQFRGDTIHPSTLEILNEIGLAEKLHKLPHTKVYGPTVMTAEGPFAPVDLRRLKIPFPYIMLMPQPDFLAFITGEAKQYPEFQLLMGANVQRLIDEDGTVRGVSYLDHAGACHEIRARLTVGADGRFSQVRQLARIQPIKTSPPMDVLWFRLPKLPEDPHVPSGLLGAFGSGRVLVVFDRGDHWQTGYVFPKGAYQDLRAAGLEALRRSIVELEPKLARHVEHLTDWRQCTLLSVESSRCATWYKPGLLLIGDAAHAMSPVGGVGINYAIQDAVVAANVLANPLKAGTVGVRHLEKIQRQRELPTKFIQKLQSIAQNRIISGSFQRQEGLRIPRVVRVLLGIPLLRKIPARIVAFGLSRVHVES
ncbi:MAG TPA: FAD-dependent oxidoreductase [Candidatus Angelobacter sp.]|nr:FAD-dependent oxidoreductase [Candidatus Angelobacter sp.]